MIFVLVTAKPETVQAVGNTGSDVIADRKLNVALEDGTPRVEDDEVAWYMVEVEHLMVQSCE